MKTLAVLLMIVAPLGLAGCGSGGGGDGAGAEAPPVEAPAVVDPTALLLAARLEALQLDNGAFGWGSVATDPVDTSGEGFQNVTGVSALGLLDVYAVDGADGDLDQAPWLPACLDATALYLLDQMQQYLDGSIDNIAFPNFIFLARYNQLLGLAPGDWQTVQDAFMKLMVERDADWGSDPDVLVDGAFQQLMRKRMDAPGLIGWDAAFILKALIAMDWPQAEIDWLVAAMKILPIDATVEYGQLSAAHMLEALLRAGDSDVEGFVIALLDHSQDADGSFDDHQIAAYAVMALRAAGVHDRADAAAAWLASEVGVDGTLLEDGGYEYPEVLSEVLQALLR